MTIHMFIHTWGEAMPVYEFECAACGYQDDRIVTVVKRDDARDCPECHETGGMKRGWSTPYIGAIPGIPNRINREFRETGPAIATTKYRQAKGDDRPLLGKKYA